MDPIFFVMGIVIGTIISLAFIKLIKILKCKLKIYLFKRFEEKERIRLDALKKKKEGE